MKFEERRTMSRGELVGLLKRLAAKLEGGVLDYTRGEVNVPDQLDVEIEYKEKNHKRKFELELRWREGRYHGQKRKKVETKACAELQPAMDDVKSGLKRLFRAIRRGLEEGEMPGLEDVSRMRELSAEFEKYSANEDWHVEQRAFTEKMAEFEKNVKNADLAGAQRLMGELRRVKKACHRDYRWKE
ncbi:MAG: amphi-Trp domain-containing protein [Candidatus Hydrothermarchaeaceae archaeon]